MADATAAAEMSVGAQQTEDSGGNDRNDISAGAENDNSNVPVAPDLGHGDGTSNEANDANAVNDDDDDEIQEVHATDYTASNRNREVITLSSDSEDVEGHESHDRLNAEANQDGTPRDGDADDDDDDQDSLEIINVLPYSYMNRSRGPKPNFLRKLLQQTNREIMQGRKIVDNTYQQVDALCLGSPEQNVPVPGAFSSATTTTASVLRKPVVIAELTLSSDDEDAAQPETQEQTTNQLDSGRPVLNEHSSGADSQAEQNERDKKEIHERNMNSTIAAECIPENGPIAAVAGHSRNVLKRKQEASEKTASPKKTRRQHNDIPENIPQDNKMARQTDFLEQLLLKKNKEIEDLGEQVVEWEDEENSAFMKLKKEKDKFMRSFNTLCKTRNLSQNTGRKIQIKFKLSENVTNVPVLEEAVEKFMNAQNRWFAPTLDDITQVVKGQLESQNLPDLDSKEVESLATFLFEDVMKKIRERRILDSLEAGYSGCQQEDLSSLFLQNNEVDDDPAAHSPELAAALEKNARERKDTEKQLAVGERFASNVQNAKPEELIECESADMDVEEALEEDEEEEAED